MLYVYDDQIKIDGGYVADVYGDNEHYVMQDMKCVCLKVTLVVKDMQVKQL